MANKRINKDGPLTAAEKQSRHRQKVKAVKMTEHEEEIAGIRKMLHVCIDKMDETRLLRFCNSLTETSNLVSESAIRVMSGLSEYEFNKLKRQGIITPVKAEVNRAAFLETVVKLATNNDDMQIID